MPENGPLAFILMPFDADFDDVYSDLIRPPLEDAGFRVRRADSLLNQRSVLQDVIRGIADAELIIADVSGLNPNVLYELGLAHAMGKRTVMLTQSIEELPFDLRPYRANEYSTRFNAAAKISESLSEIGAAVLQGRADFSNPVQDFAPQALRSEVQVARTPRHPEGGQEAASAADESDEEAEPDIGLYEANVELQEGNDRIVAVAAEIGNATKEIGDRVSERSERIDATRKNLGNKAGPVLLRIMKDTAQDFDWYSDTVEPLNKELQLAVQEISRGTNAIARFRASDQSVDPDTLEREIASLESAETAMAESFASVSGFGDRISTLPNLESTLHRATRRAARVVADTAEIIETAQAEFGRAKALLAERLATLGQQPQ